MLLNLLNFRILSTVLEVLYKQLRDWMIYGNLNDKYNEFFICHEANVQTENTTIQSVEIKALKMHEDDLGLSAFSVNEIEELFMGTKFSSNYSQFTLNTTRLPSYINLKTANKILFTGELLQLFQAKYLNEMYTSNPNESLNWQLGQNLSINKIQYIFESDKCKCYVRFSYSLDASLIGFIALKAEFNIMNEKLNVFSKEIYELSKEEFSIINFEALITKIRNHVSEVSFKYPFCFNILNESESFLTIKSLFGL